MPSIAALVIETRSADVPTTYCAAVDNGLVMMVTDVTLGGVYEDLGEGVVDSLIHGRD